MLVLTSSALYLSVGTVDCLKEDSGKSGKKFGNGSVQCDNRGLDSACPFYRRDNMGLN